MGKSYLKLNEIQFFFFFWVGGGVFPSPCKICFIRVFKNWSERSACATHGVCAGTNVGGHSTLHYFWSERSACAALGCWHKRRWPLFLVIIPCDISCAGKRTYPARFLTTAIQNHRRGCRRVSNFCMGS